MKNFILFDIGANLGRSSLSRAELDLGSEVWAFDPVPELVNHLTTHSERFKDRYHIVPMALSNKISVEYINVQTINDWGYSSLYYFNDRLHEIYPDRTDLSFSKQIWVNVMRFDHWFLSKRPNIEEIHYFNCDAQGSDLNVLKGMGEFISLINSGVIECSGDDESCNVYKGANTLKESVQYLEQHNFKIIDIVSKDKNNNEFDIHFINLK